MRAWNAVVCAGILTLAAPPDAAAGRHAVFEGPRSLRGFTHESVEFHVPGDWMRDPRLQGRIEVAGGGGRDVDVLVLHAADLPAWEKSAAVTPIHSVRRKKVVDLDVPLPGPGRYVLVVSNRFSMLASKEVRGRVLLAWSDDPALPAGEALRRQVRPVEVPAGFEALTVPVNGGDEASAVLLARSGADAPVSIRVRRSRDDGSESPVVATLAGAIEEIGTVDLHADGDRDVFIVTTVREAAGARRDLALVCPRQRACIVLSLTWAPGAEASAPVVGYGDGYEQARFAAEQSFLERVMPAYREGVSAGQ